METMQNKYRIIETQHADGSYSYSYVAEVGKCVLTRGGFLTHIEYIWKPISSPKPLLDLAKQDIEAHKANLPIKNKVVYEE